MGAFEYIVARAFDARGYWTRIGFKVDLDKQTKRQLGNPSMPRPEIDVLAYNPQKRLIRLVECKSYIDSLGVQWKAFDDPDSPTGKRFKIFHDAALLSAVTEQIKRQLSDDGLLAPGKHEVRLGLVAGKVYGADEERISAHFKEKGWDFIGPNELVLDLREFAKRGYENDVATIIVKLLERNLPKQQ